MLSAVAPGFQPLTLGSLVSIRITNKLENYPLLYLQHFIFLINYKWANNLECYITLGWKGLPVTNTLAYWVKSLVTIKLKCF
jgi:hypothetical protein